MGGLLGEFGGFDAECSASLRMVDGLLTKALGPEHRVSEQFRNLRLFDPVPGLAFLDMGNLAQSSDRSDSRFIARIPTPSELDFSH